MMMTLTHTLAALLTALPLAAVEPPKPGANPAPPPFDLMRTLHLPRDVAEAVRPKNPDQWLQDPLKFLAGDMADIASRLREHDTAEKTQQQEQALLARLDQLIELLEQACNGSGQGQGQAGGPGGGQGGPGGGGSSEPGPMRVPGRSHRAWGELPPQERERILQSRTEGFPAGYEGMLEEYFQRLAEEQVIEADDDAAVPAPQEER